MEILDKDGELLAWCSDDPDDFNSYSDYEFHILELVHKYNEQACEIGGPLLTYYKDLYDNAPSLTRHQTMVLAELVPEEVPELSELRHEIRYWAKARLFSHHPDDEYYIETELEFRQEDIQDFEKLYLTNPQEAFLHLYYLATHGEKLYQHILSLAYEYGIGTEKSLCRAAYWRNVFLKKSAFLLDV